MSKSIISQSYLKQILDYIPDTGLFAWKVKRRYGCHTGAVAGSVSSTTGYRMIKIDQQLWSAHRLAWLYTYGEFPKVQIDHINGIRTDNRIANLRDVTVQQQRQNARLSRRNKSGLHGVTWCKRDSKWFTSITFDKKMRNLGRYDTFFDAVAARKSAELKYGFHINHGRRDG